MRIEEQQVGDVTIVSLAGELDARTLPEANAKLDSLLETLRTRLVFNLAGLEIVTSTAVGFLIAAAKRARRLGGDVAISEPTRLFRRTLEALRTGEFFMLCPSDEEAVAYLGRRRAEKPAEPKAAKRRRLRWPFRLRKRDDVPPAPG